MWYIQPDERKLNVQQTTANGSLLWNFFDYQIRFGRTFYTVEYLHVHLLKSLHVYMFYFHSKGVLEIHFVCDSNKIDQ